MKTQDVAEVSDRGLAELNRQLLGSGYQLERGAKTYKVINEDGLYLFWARDVGHALRLIAKRWREYGG